MTNIFTGGILRQQDKKSPLQYTEYEKENRIQMWLKLEETDNSLIREKHKPNSEKEKMFIFLAI